MSFCYWFCCGVFNLHNECIQDLYNPYSINHNAGLSMNMAMFARSLKLQDDSLKQLRNKAFYEGALFKNKFVILITHLLDKYGMHIICAIISGIVSGIVSTIIMKALM